MEKEGNIKEVKIMQEKEITVNADGNPNGGASGETVAWKDMPTAKGSQTWFGHEQGRVYTAKRDDKGWKEEKDQMDYNLMGLALKVLKEQEIRNHPDKLKSKAKRRLANKAARKSRKANR